MSRVEDCHRCGAAVVYVGWDVLGDVACQARLDPTPLDQAGQVAAVLAGRALWRGGVEAGRRVYGRHHPATASRRVGGERTVVPEHTCGQPLARPDATLLAQPGRPAAAVPAGVCPF